MKPSFTVKLNQPVFAGLVVTGKFDGKTPSIACATTGGRIVLHSPHEATGDDGSSNSLRYLNFNRKITSLAAGQLPAKEGSDFNPDLLFVGTQSNLLAYDVERNADIFFVDVADGVNSLVVGKIGNSPNNSVIAGGNCSILGFDGKGNENFWTVTGDNVSSMALCDLDGSNQNSLIVGSDDFEMRVFRQEEVIAEITEADKIHLLHCINNGPNFIYGLNNGTVGVYAGQQGNASKLTRLWRVKTKHRPTALFAYDIDLDGVPEVFSGWSNGAFNVRRLDNGEVIFREMLDAPIAAILKSDYRMDNKEEVIVVTEAGTIYGYLPTEGEFGAMLDSGIGKESAADQKVLDDLHTQKLELIAELKLIERNTKLLKSPQDTPVGSLPAGTNLNYTVEANVDLAAVCLKVDVTTEVQIVNLIAVDLDGVVLIDREVIAISPRPQSKTAILPLKPSRNLPCSIRVQTHVATRSLGAQVHVFETDISLPKFSAFKVLTDISGLSMPKGNVVLSVKEGADRFASWIQTSFLVKDKIQADDKFRIGFVSVCKTTSGLQTVEKENGNSNNNSWANHQSRTSAKDKNTQSIGDGEVLVLTLQKYTEAGQTFTKVRIQCESMDLAADVIQDMAKFFKWNELDSEADFPKEFDAFQEVITTVAECNAARMDLTADMADDSQRIKALIIRAEDSRLMMDMDSMRRAYTELTGMNNQLIAQYNIRASNHERLLASLKEVNQMIQKAANLRMGKAKSRVISDCRAAVKANNMNSLFRILKHGYEPSNVAPSK